MTERWQYADGWAGLTNRHRAPTAATGATSFRASALDVEAPFDIRVACSNTQGLPYAAGSLTRSISRLRHSCGESSHARLADGLSVCRTVKLSMLHRLCSSGV